MKRMFSFCTAVAVGCSTTSAALAVGTVYQPELVAPAQPADAPPTPRPLGDLNNQSAIYTMPAGDYAAGCDCDAGCSTYNYGGWTLDECCLDEAWTLKSALTPCCDTVNYGGWVSMGYHSDFTRLSDENTQGFSYNDHPDNMNLHQAWLFFERVANGGDCADWGYRFDLMYGLDGQKIQSFGNPRADVPNQGRWDASLDHGVYGWAMPQAFLEYAQGDWRVIAGHFFTLVGYEVAQAPNNFFYSHSLTFFNSEPLTHTGVLASYKANDELTIHVGWTLGWDTGFDQFDDGNSLHAGIISQLSDDVSYSYMCTAGDFGWRGEGYSHSNVLSFTLSECLTYVIQNDYVNVNTPADFDNEDVGINQYLIYALNDCWSVGGRMEWWKSNSPTGDAASYYELTGGVNYRPHANLVIRPEVRFDWTPSEDAYQAVNGVDYNEFVFGIDAVLTF